MFDKEAYLIDLVKIKSSEKKKFAIKSNILFFQKLSQSDTQFELIDDKFLYGTVD